MEFGVSQRMKRVSTGFSVKIPFSLAMHLAWPAFAVMRFFRNIARRLFFERSRLGYCGCEFVDFDYDSCFHLERKQYNCHNSHCNNNNISHL